jgi:hypothetical protein
MGETSMKPSVSRDRWLALPEDQPSPKRPSRLRALDGVIMLRADGKPAGGSFPENVWVVMGAQDDDIEDFFGPRGDLLTAHLEQSAADADTRYCVGLSTDRKDMLMNGAGAYPVYVSGLIKLHRDCR